MAAMASDSAPTEDQLNQIEQHFNMILNEDDDAYLESTSTRGEQDDHDDEEDDDDDEDFEFSFVCEQSNSPIAADEIFEDGQIRPLFHFVLHDSSDHHETTSSSSPIRKVFIERTDLAEETAAEAPACAWSDKSNLNAEEPSASSSVSEICKKSNSTGFSKLFRFREMLLRSYSDGRDAFVFLANHKREDKHETTATSAATTTTTTASSQKEKVSTKEREKSWMPGKGTKKTASYVMQYGRKKTGAAARRKSYLPYRQDLVGFFTNVNGMSRNVHPY